MSYYKCERCNYMTYKKNNIVRHLNTKKKCKRDNFLDFRTDEELIEESMKVRHDELFNETFDIETKICTICSKNCLDKTNRDKHEETCKKRMKKLNFTKKQMKELYLEKKKKKEEKLKSKNDEKSDSDIESSDDNKFEKKSTLSKFKECKKEYELKKTESDDNEQKTQHVKEEYEKNPIIEEMESIPYQELEPETTSEKSPQTTINNMTVNIFNFLCCTPFDMTLDYSHLSDADITDYIIRKDKKKYDKFIDKLLENPKNHNILLNDDKHNDVVLFRSIEKGFERTNIEDVLKKYNKDSKNIIYSKTIQDPSLTHRIKNVVHLEINEQEKEFTKNIKNDDYKNERYEKLKSIIPPDENMYERFSLIKDSMDKGKISYCVRDINDKNSKRYINTQNSIQLTPEEILMIEEKRKSQKK